MGRRSGPKPTSVIAGRVLAPILLAGSICASPGLAQAADLCSPSPDDAPVRIAAVADAFDIRLEDGRTLRLAGLDVPQPTSMKADTQSTARRALEAWASPGPIVAHVLSAAPDRWGRLPAVLVRPGSADPSAATLLLGQGLARARPEPAVHACFAAFLAAEDAARTAKRGLWAEPGTAPLRADDAGGLARASGGFAIIEGILQVHAARSGTLYLTLGRDRWGFAAVLTRHDATRLAKEGLDVEDYAGSPVRLRGDLDDRFGARMHLTDPDQMQSLEPGTLEAPSATPR